MSISTLRDMGKRRFNRLENTRRLATGSDKAASNFFGFIDIACERMWLRHLST